MRQTRSAIPAARGEAREWSSAAEGEKPQSVTSIAPPAVPKPVVKPAWEDNFGQLYETGLRYYNGEEVPQDEAEALRWWLLAAEDGDPRAMYGLGVAYMNGRGAEKD